MGSSRTVLEALTGGDVSLGGRSLSNLYSSTLYYRGDDDGGEDSNLELDASRETET